MHSLLFRGIAVLFMFSFGCAKLDYVKVPSPTQYSSWSDEKQKEADEIKGVRYYLPRPFVHLKQSVPVAQRVAFVSFTYDEKSRQYQIEFPADTPAWVKRVAPKRLSITQALAATLAVPKKDSEGKALQESAAPGEQPPSTTPTPTEPPPSTLTARTGFINASDPVTHLSNVLDVVYLPDFEEQYAIVVKTGLGKADIEARLRNGWAAEVFSHTVDNSNLVPYVIRQVENASDAAAKIASTWWPAITGVGAPAIALTRELAKGMDKARQEAGTPSDIKSLLADLLLFKIAEIRVAQPGLYPILKPREIRQWWKATQPGVLLDVDQDVAFEAFLQNSNTPWIRPDLAFVPSPPFTMVGFNVTTEVFLAPATERLNVSVVPPPPSQEPVDRTGDVGLKQIKDRLLQTAAASSIESIKTLKAELIEVRPDDLGSGTVIVLKNLSNPFKATDQVAHRTWIKDALGLSDDEASKMEFNPKSGDSKDLTVRITNLKAADLMGRLGSSSTPPSGMLSPTGAEAKAKQAITDLLTKALANAPDDATKDIDPAQIAVHATSPNPSGTKLTIHSKTVPFQQANERQQKTWLASALKLTQGEMSSLAIKYDPNNPTTLDVTLDSVSLDIWPGKVP